MEETGRGKREGRGKRVGRVKNKEKKKRKKKKLKCGTGCRRRIVWRISRLISARKHATMGEGRYAKRRGLYAEKIFCRRFTFLRSYHSACTTLATLFLFILHDWYIYMCVQEEASTRWNSTSSFFPLRSTIIFRGRKKENNDIFILMPCNGIFKEIYTFVCKFLIDERNYF